MPRREGVQLSSDRVVAQHVVHVEGVVPQEHAAVDGASVLDLFSGRLSVRFAERRLRRASLLANVVAQVAILLRSI